MKAQWDNVGLRTFIDICVEEVNANNRGKEGTLSPLGYENVVRKFFERTRREYTKKRFKNKWDVLKKEYAVWKTLTQKASGIGFDPVTKTIAASDEWWANEIQVYIWSYQFHLFLLFFFYQFLH